MGLSFSYHRNSMICRRCNEGCAAGDATIPRVFERRCDRLWREAGERIPAEEGFALGVGAGRLSKMRWRGGRDARVSGVEAGELSEVVWKVKGRLANVSAVCSRIGSLTLGKRVLTDWFPECRDRIVEVWDDGDFRRSLRSTFDALFRPNTGRPHLIWRHCLGGGMGSSRVR